MIGAKSHPRCLAIIFFIIISATAESSEFGNYYGNKELEQESRVISSKILDSIEKIFDYIQKFENGDGDKAEISPIGRDLVKYSFELKKLIQSSTSDITIDYNIIDFDEAAKLKECLIISYGNSDFSMPRTLNQMYFEHAQATFEFGNRLVRVGDGELVGPGDFASGAGLFLDALANYIRLSRVTVAIGRQVLR